LEKDPKRRLRDIGDALPLLEEMPPQPTAPLPSWLGWVAVALALALIVLGALLWRATRPTDRPLVRLRVDLGPDVSLGSYAGADAIISADDTRLVYVSHNRLFTRRLSQPQATELPLTDGAHAPFFSPDGQWVAFFAGGKLKKVSVAGFHASRHGFLQPMYHQLLSRLAAARGSHGP
jgi:serine/threonine-protein kinase